MRTCESLYKLDQFGNMKHDTKESEESHIKLISYAAAKGFKIIRAIYKILDEEEAEKDRDRSAYFAYLGQVIKEGHEEFAGGIPGKSIAAKVNSLDYCMRGQFCEMYPQYYKIIYISLPGQKPKAKREIFSVSREHCTISSDELKIYYQWAKEEIYKAHKVFTGRNGEEWAPEYWIA